jgi:hypothetical protein
MKRYVILLQPINVEQPFSQWGLDFVEPINPNSRKGHMYILTTTDYFTKWPKEVELKRDDSEDLIMFLRDNIFLIFGVPYKFITDTG